MKNFEYNVKWIISNRDYAVCKYCTKVVNCFIMGCTQCNPEHLVPQHNYIGNYVDIASAQTEKDFLEMFQQVLEDDSPQPGEDWLATKCRHRFSGMDIKELLY